MKLIGSSTSPYVRKVRVLLLEKQLDCDFIQEDVWSRDTKILSYNPLGKVPCLILDDGEPLYDSRVICEYLDALPAADNLIPAAGSARIMVRRWEALADGVLDAGVLMRLEHTQREPSERSEKWLARQRAKVMAGLEAMERDLGGREWCASGCFTLADIAIGCTLGWLEFRQPEIAWRSHHLNLARLYTKLMEHRSFMDSMPHT